MVLQPSDTSCADSKSAGGSIKPLRRRNVERRHRAIIKSFSRGIAAAEFNSGKYPIDEVPDPDGELNIVFD